ncbi:MAG: hypothetical protein JW744_00480 [Candidatus Diapherotrites archaeon]|uniref:Alpha-galactosidase NEW3 domain-containing protein n=1 Tax=Candidatus Iainarchaeum sp. TaxID=3101447 RepID=A0A938YWF2_9ARCH|nr:hypothetical protein [Candidatus Diapherotrites archaeon]
MNKWIFIAAIAVLIAGNAAGLGLFERSFQDMGYESFSVQGANKRSCTEIEFLFPQDINAMDSEIYPIASLGFELGPVQGQIDANAHLNGSRVAGLGIEDLKCSSGQCWERLALPKDALLKEENTLRVCIKTSNSVVEAVLLDSSAVGLYRTADFSKEDAFRVEAEKKDVLIGERVRINVSIHNYGSDTALAEVRYARRLAEDKNAFVVVEGTAYFEGTVKQNETREFSYEIKPRVLGSITMPPAILYYENEFGEGEQKFANLVQINVREPEIKVDAFLAKSRETAPVSEPIELELAVRNQGKDTLYGLAVELELPQGLELLGQPETSIEALAPGQTELIKFRVSSTSAGKFPIGCKIEYVDLNAEETFCRDSFVAFEEPGISPLIYGGIAMAVIALAVYLYFRFSK